MSKKIQIFVFRSGNEQFMFWDDEVKEWCQKYKDYFTIIDDGNTPIENNIFKVMKISDFKDPIPNIKNEKALEGTALLNIVKNLDQFDYQYIGLLHMDFMPLYFNEQFFLTNLKYGYPIQKRDLFNLQEAIDMIQKQENKDKEFIFSFQTLTLFKTIQNHFFGQQMSIDGKNLWEFCINKFKLFDIYKRIPFQNWEDIRIPICNALLAKKSYWKTNQIFLDNLDQIYNVYQYHTYITMNKRKDILTAHLLEVFNQLNVLDYLEKNSDVEFQLLPVCHFCTKEYKNK